MRLLFALLLTALCAIAAAATPQCYTGVLEWRAGATAIVLSGGLPDAPASEVWHFNARTLHAAALVTRDTEALLMANYAAAPDTLVLEHYDLASGAALGASVALERHPATPMPTRMCATTYDVYVVEQGGTLSHYSRATGAALPLAATAPAAVRDIACTANHMYALTGAAVLELDPADALPLALVMAAPAGARLEARPDNTLALQLGAPSALVLVYDLHRRAVVAFNDVAQAVSVSSAPIDPSYCMVSSLNATTGIWRAVPTALVPPCAALAPDVVAAEALLWRVDPATGAVTPLGAAGTALANGGNLRDAVALAPDPEDATRLVAVSSDGVVTVLRYDPATTALRLEQRLASLAGARPLEPLMPLAPLCDNCDWMAPPAWRDAAGTLRARTAAGATIELPPLGGAVFDVAWRDPAALCVLMTNEVHCFDMDSASLSASATLPAALSAKMPYVSLAHDGAGALLVLSTDTGRHGVTEVVVHQADVSDAAPDAYELCRVSVLPANFEMVRQIDAPLLGPEVLVLRGPGDDYLMRLSLDNCTAMYGAQLHDAASSTVALVPGFASCILGEPRIHRLPQPVLWPLRVAGALVLCCCVPAVALVLLYNVLRSAVLRRSGRKRPAPLAASFRVLKAAFCRCLPDKWYTAIGDPFDDADYGDQVPMSSPPFIFGDDHHQAQPTSLLADDTTAAVAASYYTPSRAATSSTTAPFSSIPLGDGRPATTAGFV